MMKLRDLGKHPQWLILGAVVFAAVVGGSLRVLFPQGADLAGENGNAAAVKVDADAAESAALFESPMFSLSRELQAAERPSALLLSTSGEERLSGIVAGRLDPFAPVTQTVGTPRQDPEDTSTAATANDSGTANNPVVTSQPLPIPDAANGGNLPPVPVVNWSPVPTPLPAIPIASTPIMVQDLPSFETAVAPRHPVDAIELSGVVQVGDRVGVIVRETSGATSRHLFVGDSLANGQIRVKSIDLSAQEPLVILEYQGEEYPRMIGSGGSLDIS